MKRGLAALLGAPHRAMFFAGTVFLLVVAVLWVLALGARLAGAGLLPAAMPAGWLHGAAMTFAVFPFFIFGFAMTAMPRWQAVPEVAPALYRATFALMVSGWFAVLGAAWMPGLAWPGLVLVAAGWAAGAVRLTRVALHPNPGRSNLIFVVAGLWAGFAGIGLLIAAVLAGQVVALGAALEIGVWWFLVPVFVSVSHRVIPFFTSTEVSGYAVRRPAWALHGILAASAAHGALRLAQAGEWTWVADSVGAAAALYLSWCWDLRRGLRAGLAAMHHVAFAWLGISCVLFSLQGLLALAGMHTLGLAPLHALTIGFFGTMVLGMATRVTLGHSGRPVIADGLTRKLMWGLQAVAVARIAAELAPASTAPVLTFLAACGWLIVFAAWSVRFAPLYWQARPDGRPD